MDDLMPNDGQAYSSDPRIETPAETIKKGMVSLAHPVETVEWFEDQIANADSLMNIETTELKIGDVTYTRKVSIEAQVLAQQMLGELLRTKMQEYQHFLDQVKWF